MREAPRRLEREGLVAVSPHRGANVAALTPAEIAGRHEGQELLECQAVWPTPAAPSDVSREEAFGAGKGGRWVGPLMPMPNGQ